MPDSFTFASILEIVKKIDANAEDIPPANTDSSEDIPPATPDTNPEDIPPATPDTNMELNPLHKELISSFINRDRSRKLAEIKEYENAWEILSIDTNEALEQLSKGINVKQLVITKSREQLELIRRARLVMERTTAGSVVDLVGETNSVNMDAETGKVICDTEEQIDANEVISDTEEQIDANEVISDTEELNDTNEVISDTKKEKFESQRSSGKERQAPSPSVVTPPVIHESVSSVAQVREMPQKGGENKHKNEDDFSFHMKAIGQEKKLTKESGLRKPKQESAKWSSDEGCSASDDDEERDEYGDLIINKKRDASVIPKIRKSSILPNMRKCDRELKETNALNRSRRDPPLAPHPLRDDGRKHSPHYHNRYHGYTYSYSPRAERYCGPDTRDQYLHQGYASYQGFASGNESPNQVFNPEYSDPSRHSTRYNESSHSYYNDHVNYYTKDPKYNKISQQSSRPSCMPPTRTKQRGKDRRFEPVILLDRNSQSNTNNINEDVHKSSLQKTEKKKLFAVGERDTVKMKDTGDGGTSCGAEKGTSRKEENSSSAHHRRTGTSAGLKTQGNDNNNDNEAEDFKKNILDFTTSKKVNFEAKLCLLQIITEAVMPPSCEVATRCAADPCGCCEDQFSVSTQDTSYKYSPDIVPPPLVTGTHNNEPERRDAITYTQEAEEEESEETYSQEEYGGGGLELYATTSQEEDSAEIGQGNDELDSSSSDSANERYASFYDSEADSPQQEDVGHNRESELYGNCEAESQSNTRSGPEECRDSRPQHDYTDHHAAPQHHTKPHHHTSYQYHQNNNQNRQINHDPYHHHHRHHPHHTAVTHPSSSHHSYAPPPPLSHHNHHCHTCHSSSYAPPLPSPCHHHHHCYAPPTNLCCHAHSQHVERHRLMDYNIRSLAHTNAELAFQYSTQNYQQHYKQNNRQHYPQRHRQRYPQNHPQHHPQQRSNDIQQQRERHQKPQQRPKEQQQQHQQQRQQQQKQPQIQQEQRNKQQEQKNNKQELQQQQQQQTSTEQEKQRSQQQKRSMKRLRLHQIKKRRLQRKRQQAIKLQQQQLNEQQPNKQQQMTTTAIKAVATNKAATTTTAAANENGTGTGTEKATVTTTEAIDEATTAAPNQEAPTTEEATASDQAAATTTK